MKNRMIIILAVIMSLCSIAYGLAAPPVQNKRPSDYTYSGVIQTRAIQLSARTEIETDVCETSGGNWRDTDANRSAGLYGFQIIPPGWKSVSLMAYAYGDGTGVGSPDAATFSYSIYLCDYFGGALLMSSGTGVVGKRQLSHNPTTGTVVAPMTGCNAFLGTTDSNYCWVDTLSNTAVWRSTVTAANVAGTDDISSLNFSTCGAYMIRVVTTAMAGETALIWIMKPID